VNRTKKKLNRYEPVEYSNELVEPDRVRDILSLDYEQLRTAYGYPYPG
jgi:hypothetical protein